MPLTTPSFARSRFARRDLLFAGGTLMAGVLAGKCGGGARAAVPAPPPRPLSALHVHPPTMLPPLRFVGPDGGARSLRDDAGEGLVLNFWATWCPPCVAEMPALAQLARALARSGMRVLPVSEDRGGVDVVRAFYAAHGIVGLPVLLDVQSRAMLALGLDGVPTTLVIDRMGREVARVQGAIQWDAPDAKVLIARLID